MDIVATGSRTLKLSILGDVSDLNKSLKSADADVSSFGDKISKFGKIAAAGFLVAGAAATKFGIDAVKNAAADEAAQRTLATTIQNTTDATQKQISAVESWITTTSLAKGVTDDVIRPAFARLTRSTKDVEESQKLLNLALDISSATGKPLEAISNSLGKAYDGNTAALGRLGLGIDQTIIKSGDFDAVYTALRGTFKGFAEQEANTFEGKLRRLQIAFDEGKETIGSFIIDAITPLVTLIVEQVVPIINELSTTIGEKLSPVFANLSTFFTEVLVPAFKVWWSFITEIVIPGIVGFFTPVLEGVSEAFSKVAKTITDNRKTLQPLFDLIVTFYKFAATYLAPFLGEVLGAAFKVLGEIISGVISLFARLVKLITDAVNAVKALASALANSVVGKFVGNIASGLGSVFGGGRANGGSVSAGTSYLVGERGAELFTPQSNGSIIPNGSMGGNVTYNINVSGAIDQESVARQIVTLLNNSTARGTQGASNFSYLGAF